MTNSPDWIERALDTVLTVTLCPPGSDSLPPQFHAKFSRSG